MRFQRDLGGSGKFSFGPSYQVYRFNSRDNVDKFITSSESDVYQSELEQTKFYGGLTSLFEFDRRDNIKLPIKGFYFKQETQFFRGLNEAAGNFSFVSAELRLFWSFLYPSKLVWANRMGVGKNFGQYEYFQGKTLGGLDNQRFKTISLQWRCRCIL